MENQGQRSLVAVLATVSQNQKIASITSAGESTVTVLYSLWYEHAWYDRESQYV